MGNVGGYQGKWATWGATCGILSTCCVVRGSTSMCHATCRILLIGILWKLFREIHQVLFTHL